MSLILVLEESTNYHFLYESDVIPIPGDIISEYNKNNSEDFLVIKRRIRTDIDDSITIYVTKVEK